jgi:hypothetical protein
MSKKDLPEYRAWTNMKARCYAPSCKDHGTYQKNGISVCDEWMNNFPLFLFDMGNKPSDSHSLDRKDNSKGYSKDNCHWTTDLYQAKNRGDFTPLFAHNGEEKILKEWACELGINYTTLRHRIFKKGMCFEDAIKRDPFNRGVIINGEEKTVKEWCLHFNQKYPLVICRIHRGWDKIKAITTPTTFELQH